MNTSSLALGPYLEIIEELCRPLDRDSLQQCVVALAKQVKPENRQIFLQNFRSILPDNEHREIAVAMIEESSLMNEMASIRREVENRLRTLEAFSSEHTSDHDDRDPVFPGKGKIVH